FLPGGVDARGAQALAYPSHRDDTSGRRGRGDVVPPLHLSTQYTLSRCADRPSSRRRSAWRGGYSSDRRAGSCWQPLASLRRVTTGAELRIVLDDRRRGTLP